MLVHSIIWGILLGFGAAIPVGPVNLEIIRRNLKFGTSVGLALGFGACTADLTYLTLLLFGLLTFISHPLVLHYVAIIGSLMLGGFGIMILRDQNKESSGESKCKKKANIKHFVEGYLITLVNPYTILFWASVSAQIAAMAESHTLSSSFAAVGMLLGVTMWAIGLNVTLHFTRHKFSEKAMHHLNQISGLILLGFSAFGLYHAIA